jgi:hypothetical protein
MSTETAVSSLLRLANKIAAAHPPHQRQSQWDAWSRKVRMAERDHPEITGLGLTLTYNQFSDDLRALGRYAEDKQPSSPKRPLRTTEAGNLVTIFISHKAEDAALARSIKKIMEVYAAGRLIFHISEEMPKGTDWYKWIKDRLVESRMLLLLFTDNDAPWDWCLYEAGLFTQWDDDKRRIICLHSGQHPPAPLRHLQSVPAVGEEIALLLRQLLVETELTGLQSPLNAMLASNPAELKRAADKIAKAMRRETVRQEYFTKYILINVDRATRLAEGIPNDALIESDADSLALFNKKIGKWTWEDLVGSGEEGLDRRWIGELNRAVRQASSRSLVDPIFATLRVRQTGRSYRPILHRMATKSDGNQQFTVLFVEDLSWGMMGVRSKLPTLLVALIMIVRFRFEVIERYARQTIEQYHGMSEEAICLEIKQSIVNIELEAESHGLLDVSAFLDAFDLEQDRETVKALFDSWHDLRPNLFEVLERGRLKDTAPFFDALRQANRRFFELVAARHYELAKH